MEQESNRESEVSASSSDERIQILIDKIINKDVLSPPAQRVLTHLKRSEKDLADFNTDKLSQIILEALQS